MDVAVDVASQWVVAASVDAAGGVASRAATARENTEETHSVLAQRRQSQTIERLAKLLQVFARQFRVDDKLDAERFERTWRLVSITSAEGTQQSFVAA